MTLRFFSLLFSLGLFLAAAGQEYEVDVFKNVPEDLSARTKKCALLKVDAGDRIDHVNGASVGDVEKRGRNQWVYMAPGSEAVELVFDAHAPLQIIFSDHGYPTLSEQETYVVKLREKEVEPTVVVVKPIDESTEKILRQAKDSYNKGDYTTALPLFQQISDNAEAQFYLGLMYRNGRGVDRSNAEAVIWYRKSADQGYADAQCNLGYMYENGLGVPQDYTEAVRWYRKSADQGHARAQCNLGYMYGNGLGVPQDYTEAVRWYCKSADQGHAIGQCNLGYMYSNGLGVPQDYTEAVRWYRKSADQGDTGAQCNLGYMYENGLGVPQDYTEAVKWYRKAADQGHAIGQCNLGIMYEYGKGVEKDISEAIRWYRKAAAQGDEDAIKGLKRLNVE